MKKPNIILVSLIIVIILLIMIFVLLSKLITNSTGGQKKSQIGQELSSHPTSSPLLFNEKFYLNYSDSELKVGNIPYLDSNFSNYYHFVFEDGNTPPHYTLYALVDASQFSSSREVYERIYTSITPTGSLLSTHEASIHGSDVSMALIDAPFGDGAYEILGGIKIKNKGYYFEEYLGQKKNKLSVDEINKLFEHSYLTIQQNFYNITGKLIEENIPDEYFHRYINNVPQNIIDSLKQANHGEFPSTF